MVEHLIYNHCSQKTAQYQDFHQLCLNQVPALEAVRSWGCFPAVATPPRLGCSLNLFPVPACAAEPLWQRLKHLPSTRVPNFKPKPAIPVSTADYLIKRHQFSQETALTAASVITYSKKPEKSDSILAFLKESGFSQTHLEKTVKRVPRVLSANLDKTIKPKIKIFQDLGCTPTDIAYIISQPHGCDLPRFNATDLMERSRNRRIVFVGDSIGRNQWESLLCMLTTAVSNQSAIYEVNGNPITKHRATSLSDFKTTTSQSNITERPS
ncbi:hypothetical protein AAG906_008694 [Vitis piasezkii]